MVWWKWQINDDCISILDGHEAEDVTSSLSTDGVLTVTAPKKTLTPEVNKRIVPITQTDEVLMDEKTDDDQDQEKK